MTSVLNANYDAAMNLLQDDSTLKLSITNLIFFKEWYEGKEEESKAIVKDMINKKHQVSFMGGWVDLADQIGDYHLVSDNLLKA